MTTTRRAWDGKTRPIRASLLRNWTAVYSPTSTRCSNSSSRSRWTIPRSMAPSFSTTVRLPSPTPRPGCRRQQEQQLQPRLKTTTLLMMIPERTGKCARMTISTPWTSTMPSSLSSSSSRQPRTAMTAMTKPPSSMGPSWLVPDVVAHPLAGAEPSP